MTSEAESDLKLEIGHVLMMDLVAYSTLLINEQSRIISELKQIVRSTARFQQVDAEGKLVCVPTGDGMLLVFFNPEAPIECAMEISAAIRNHPGIRLRMGIQSRLTEPWLQQEIPSPFGMTQAKRLCHLGDACIVAWYSGFL